jgi:hypothetical protein
MSTSKVTEGLSYLSKLGYRGALILNFFVSPEHGYW